MAWKKKSAVTDGAPREKKQRWYHNVRDAYQLTRQAEPSITWLLLGVFVLVLGVALGIGFIWGHPVYMGFFGLLLAALLMMTLLASRTRKASYAQIDGRAGAAGAVLGQIRRGWTIEEQPVAVNPRTQDLVHRMVGRPGVVLVSEGPSSRVRRLVDDERRKINRVAPNVPVHVIEYGHGDGQVPLEGLQKAVRKLRPKLTSAEVAQVVKRLQALGTAKLPIPKGVDPMRARPDRKGMRGR